ncbi:MAG: transposase [Hyphomicrobiales bacterium]|nr:transposase [Hyphomicrobiales bacterium]
MWDRREEVCLYVCSAPISAQKAAAAIRGHWGIENQNHFVRDGSMFEDASRIRTNPGIFARARNLALNIMRANGEQNIADALWRNALDFNRVLNCHFK